MKTCRNIYEEIVSFENLLSAAGKASRCKRQTKGVLDFFYHLEDELWALHAELKEKTWKPGAYNTFYIYKPKHRMISAAPFRDRVVHHALINRIGPVMERSMIHDSYANRKGKGTHKAIKRYQQYLRRFQYVLKCDIRKFFPSIDHDILKVLLYRKFACPETRWLIATVIDNGNAQESPLDYFPGDMLFTPFERTKGLPIGNLTSQFFANYFLNGFDHFVKETLHCKGYVRYVDDFVLFSNSKEELRQWEKEIEAFLEILRLKLNPEGTALYPSSEGRPFLGQIVFPSHRLLPSANVRAFKKKLTALETAPIEKRQSSIAGWTGHARQADTRRLREVLGV
ncbi:MAG: RNA-directed DNA polymerase [Chlorobiales bacterium]|nr:RNA-directed DNA polymerase [Chlorobiales bacterium]